MQFTSVVFPDPLGADHSKEFPPFEVETHIEDCKHATEALL
jgi:hypothetical protein